MFLLVRLLNALGRPSSPVVLFFSTPLETKMIWEVLALEADNLPLAITGTLSRRDLSSVLTR